MTLAAAAVAAVIVCLYVVCSDVDFYASMRRPALLKMRRCNSTSYNGDVIVPTTPMSCDGVTLLSLPSFHSTAVGNSVPVPGSSRYRTDDPMSTSLLDRNESWSSFSSLHSLPEPFLCRNHNDSASRGMLDAFRPIPESSVGITDMNGWHESRRGVSHRTLSPVVNGYASAEPRMQSVFHRPSNGPTGYSSGWSNDSGTLRASSVGHEIDSATFGDENQLNSGKNPTSGQSDGHKPGTIRSSSARPANSVLGHLMRAKSVTSKTLRKFAPKFSGSTKSIGAGEAGTPGTHDVKNAIVRRSSSIAQRFRSLRQPWTEPHLGVGAVDGKRGPLSLRRARERSPLANDTPSGHIPNSLNNVVAAPKSNTAYTSIAGKDPPRRVLFGASALKDGRQIPESSKSRLSFHGRDRTTSCGDEMTGGSNVPAIRPRSTEPLSKSVRIEPASYLIKTSSPIAIESRRSATHNGSPPRIGSNYSPSQFFHSVPAARSPRMASPESSSLSSGSPASVFSAVPPPSDSFQRSNPALPSPTMESAPSMSDLSLWEMPKLDIDLMDHVFVGQGYRTSSDIIPATARTVLWTSERTQSVDTGNISTRIDAFAAAEADGTFGGGVEPSRNVPDSMTSKTQEQTGSELMLTASKSTSGRKSDSLVKSVSQNDKRPSSTRRMSSRLRAGKPNDDSVLVSKDLNCVEALSLGQSDASHVNHTATSQFQTL